MKTDQIPPPEESDAQNHETKGGCQQDAGSAGCFACKFCGPKIGEMKTLSGRIMQMIRCDHPGWENEDTDMREFAAEFGDQCSDFQVLLSSPNVKGEAPPPESTGAKTQKSN